ncbi:hypothetical protein GCM10017744_016560 [Streptomyces antimycoticus]|uniref:Uncharacterized protein n=3 Tax=Streptomyces violaceusniger group TaxID=2839105 RepID=A0A4D4KP27_9ACTN|nr:MULTISPECIES: hypothetical protein [Streptomyces]AEM83427.1 hypothetical protein Strvi_3765 [Streptomyces violaceusniger Tu 4113]BBJ38903.1 hypothetical protein SSPO_016210 [Streptomyces antimycoticus]GDY47619.1 hypothetical protein SANT12839_085010 [Streptomyces antimycoticus]SED08109.1 hypothetical protein SAMN04490356_6826 [Streptomyces melanosporofaciens]
MTPEQTQSDDARADNSGRFVQATEVGSLEVWARSAPIRLAGYEDDLAEPHILQSVD